MTRRLAFAVGVLALLSLLAGCSAAGSLSLQPVDDVSLAANASRSLDEVGGDYVESERPPDQVARAAIENGSTTAAGLSPPVSEGLPFEFEGAYYELSREVVDSRTTNAVSIELAPRATTQNASVVAYEDLPAADRAALDPLFPPADDAPVGVGATYTDAELERSVLAPVQEYDAVSYGGTRYALRVEGPREVTVETYRYEATRIAPNASAFAAHLRERYAFALSNLSADERSVVEAALDDSYYAESTDDAAFDSLVSTFRDHEALTGGEGAGTWLVRYDGDLYLADLHYGPFLEERE